MTTIMICPECGCEWGISYNTCEVCGSTVTPVEYDRKQWREEMEHELRLSGVEF